MDGYYKHVDGSVGGYFNGAEPPAGSEYLGTEPPAPSIEQWRLGCIVSDIQLRKALVEQGLYETVETQVKTAPLLMRVLWDRAITLKRLDPDLVGFAKTQLSMADSEIDDLFKLAETK